MSHFMPQVLVVVVQPIDFATPTSYNLTEVNMGRFALTQEIVDMLSMYLPNLQHLKCSTRKVIDRSPGNIATIKSLALANLRNLNIFQYNIGNAMLGNFDHLFIYFSYPNQGEELYFDVNPIGDDKFVSSPTAHAFIQQCHENASLKLKEIRLEIDKIDTIFLTSGSFDLIFVQFKSVFQLNIQFS